MTVEQIQIAKIVISGVAFFLAAGYYLLKTGRLHAEARFVFDIVFVTTALISASAYFEFGEKRFGIYMNPHDVYHYYLGSKYSEEIEYDNLYRAALVADRELGAKFREKSIRNLDNNAMESVTSVMAQAGAIKGRFTPARWEEFKKDYGYFRGLVPDWKLSHMLRDKGYNGAPAWNSLARWMCNHAPTDNANAMRFLTYIDLGFLLLMFGGVWAAFGWRAMLWTVLFHGVNYFMAFVHIKGGFMRLDWFAACVLAVCLLKLRHHAAAGICVAWAVMSRIFPVIFCFGLGAKLLFNLFDVWRTRNRPEEDRVKFAWKYVAFFAAFGTALLIFAGASVWADGGIHLWKAFFSKIELHNNDISTTRVGFKYIFLWQQTNMAAAFTQYHTLWQGILALVAAVSLLFMIRGEDYEAFALGFVPFFFFVAPTFYYFVILMVPFLYFVSRPELPERALGLALMFLLSGACFMFNFKYEQNFQLFFIASCMLLALCGYLGACSFFPVRRRMAIAGPLGLEMSIAEGEPAEYQTRAGSVADTKPPTPENPVADLFQYATGFALAILLASGALWAYAAATGKPIAGLFSLNGIPATTPIAPPTAPPTSAASYSEEEKSGDAPADLANAATPEATAPPATLPGLPEPAPVAIPSAKKEGEVELDFVGDIMMNRGVAKSLQETKRPYTFPFNVVKPMIAAADIAFANLENPVSGRGEKLAQKRYVFNAKPETAIAVADAGFDIVSLANNHTLDYGPVALEDTIANVTNSGMKPLGITTNEDPQTPVIFEKNSIKIGFIAFADPVPGFSYAKEFYEFQKRPAKGTKENIQRDIATLRPQVDILVVSMHWGIEYNPPTQEEIELGHFIIDQGANIVAGHHPHVQQEAQLYKNGLIIYSMGNFVFDQRSRKDTRESRLYRVYAAKDGFHRAEYLPLELTVDVWQPHPVSASFVPVTATDSPKSMEEIKPGLPGKTDSNAGG